jgi:hypothetical protein
MSKGSSPRPYSVGLDKFADNWDAIFKKKSEPVVEENKDQKEKENKDELG